VGVTARQQVMLTRTKAKAESVFLVALWTAVLPSRRPRRCRPTSPGLAMACNIWECEAFERLASHLTLYPQ